MARNKNRERRREPQRGGAVERGEQQAGGPADAQDRQPQPTPADMPSRKSQKRFGHN
ncbi:hypothetical protein ACFYYR_22195 [Streptomyces sp. NPDC001922]|uniref:hypothetical protein n=1 Tax=Streptomyces sp. NPDC001922 TaxID=3364624 RepID=UPI0036CC4E87